MGRLARRSLTWIAVAALSAPGAAAQALAASLGSRAKYIGGTAAAISQQTGGRIDATDDRYLRFRTKASTLEVAYSQVNLLEYGQKAERRYILAILISPLFLLAKSRRHFLTVGYADAQGNQQALVFQVSKGDIRAALANLEAKTGLQVRYQDEEARMAARE